MRRWWIQRVIKVAWGSVGLMDRMFRPKSEMPMPVGGPMVTGTVGAA